jgi:hypothetical protein
LGAWLLCDGVVAVVDVVGVVAVDDGVDVVELAAFASAAPPPATAPVTTSAVSTGLIRCRMSFTSLDRLQPTIPQTRLSNVGDP